MTVDDDARALVARHAAPAGDLVPHRLVDVAESPRAGGWSLRAALVRFAQPEPALASAVLAEVRRCDAALHPLRRVLERTDVVTDDDLAPGTLTGPPTAPRRDARAADLARVLDRFADGEALATAYDAATGLDDDERRAAVLLVPVLHLDRLADRLARWADEWVDAPPTADVEALLGAAVERLDRIGVPREGDGRPPPRRRS